MNETNLNNQNQKEQSQKEQSQKEQSQKEQSQKEQSQKEQSQKEQSQKEQRQKIRTTQSYGSHVYPYSYKPDYTIQEVLEKADSLIQTEQPESAKKFSLAGRIKVSRAGVNFFTASWMSNCIQAKKNPESIAKKMGNNPVINWEILAESHFKIAMPKKITRTAIFTLKLTFSFRKNQLK